MKKKKKKEEKKALTGEELYLSLQKKWASSFTMRRNHGEGKTKEK